MNQVAGLFRILLPCWQCPIQKYLLCALALCLFSYLGQEAGREKERNLPWMAAFVYSLFKHRQPHVEPHRVAGFLNLQHLLSPFFINLSLNCLHAFPFSSFCRIRFYPPWRTSSTTVQLASLPFAFFSFPSPLPFSIILSLPSLLPQALWSFT